MLRKAVEAKLAFSGSDLVEFACINDKVLATAAVHNSVERLTAEDMEYLYGEIDDEVIIEICKQRNILLPEDLREEKEYEDEEPEEIKANEPLEEVDIYVEDYSPLPKRPGFFSTLFVVVKYSCNSGD